MENQPTTSPQIFQQLNNNPVEQSSTTKHKTSLMWPVLITFFISAIFFGFGGFWLGASNVVTTKNQDEKNETVVSNNFSTNEKPKNNTLYWGKINGIGVIYLTNWRQAYSTGIPEDEYTGKVYGKKIASTGNVTTIDTYTDFRKLENPVELVSLGDALVSDVFDTISVKANSKLFVYVSFSAQSPNGKPTYSIYEVDTNTKQLREVWTYDFTEDPEQFGISESKPSFGEVVEDTYLSFSVDDNFYSWNGHKAIINLSTGKVKYLPKSVGVKINADAQTVNYRPVGNLDVEFFSGGGYAPDQIEKINNATGQVDEEPLP